MPSSAIHSAAAQILLEILLCSASMRVDAAPTIRQAGSLHVARAAHTATTLASGEVLVAGGMGMGGGSLAGAELIDPGTGSIREIAPMHEPRVGHTATLLESGRVVVAGGFNGEYLSSVEIFDPVRRTFSRSGSLLEARSGQTATLLRDGRILFAGGVGRGWTFLRSVEIYDPRTGRSHRVQPMSVPRESHTATRLDDGRVLIVGGHSGRRAAMRVYRSAEIFDPRTARFEPAGSLAVERHKHDAVRLIDGRVLVVGGADHTDHLYYSSTEIFDVRTATFKAGPAMQSSRYKISGTTVVLPGGDVLVTAGATAAELLARGSARFAVVPGRFSDAYHFAASAILPDGDVLVVGGYSDANQNTAGVWRFSRRQHPMVTRSSAASTREARSSSIARDRLQTGESSARLIRLTDALNEPAGIGRVRRWPQRATYGYTSAGLIWTNLTRRPLSSSITRQSSSRCGSPH